MTSKLLSTSISRPLSQLPFCRHRTNRRISSQRSRVMQIWSCATSHLFIPNYTILSDYEKTAAERRGSELHDAFRRTNGNLEQCYVNFLHDITKTKSIALQPGTQVGIFRTIFFLQSYTMFRWCCCFFNPSRFFQSRLWLHLFLIVLNLGHHDACHVQVHDRRDCGWIGINSETCEDRGCCYDDRYPKAIYCFYPKGK